MRRNKAYWREIVNELTPMEFIALGEVISDKCKEISKLMEK